jgi:PAS domain S-box-containing protein
LEVRTKGKVLIIDDEEGIRFTLKRFLENDGYWVDEAESYSEAISLIGASEYDFIFADIVLGGRSGIDFLRSARENGLQSPVIMLTGSPSIETASEAVRLGAYDYIPKPFSKEQVLRLADMALNNKRLTDENEKFRSNLEAIFRSVHDGIVAVDREMNITALNDAFMKGCGVNEDIIGKNYSALPEDCSGHCKDALAESIKKKITIERFRVSCGAGNRVVNLTASPLLGDDGRLIGAVIVVRDMTRQAALEESGPDRTEYAGMVGSSPAMRKVYSMIGDLANLDSTVLITGESGTGKELVARALHNEGIRKNGSFVAVNCSAIGDNLLESELFGHVKGAFTGALRDRAGRFEAADGGTIFLDEIGDISTQMQLRLLRVLQEREFERVGDDRTRKVDVRVIAATNRDIPEKLGDGSFREDLYYRLNVIEIQMPALRERREDLPLLVDYFIKKFNSQFKKAIKSLSGDAMDIFMEHQWPGNIRQMENVIEHAAIQCKGEAITSECLPGSFLSTGASASKSLTGTASADGEAKAIREALEKSAWNKAKAARLLGISRATIYRKMDEYGIGEKP